MSTTAAFHMDDAQPRYDSGESVITDSDFEDYEAEEWSPSNTSRLYWLGKHIFQDVLTHAVFDESRSNSTGEELDAAVVMRIANFPFEERSTQLSDVVSSDARVADRLVTSNVFDRFATLLGWSYSSASNDMKTRIATLVRGGQTSATAQPTGQPARAGTTATTSSHNLESPDSQTTGEGLNRHTSALDRYCDKEGLAVDWPTTEVPGPRTKFRCLARIEGREFEGSGKNMRDARHRASRKACAAFGIEV